MTTAALLLPALLAWLYSILGGIEFGLPTVWLLAGAADRRRLSAYLSPVWEVTNVLAVLALTGFVVLFPIQLPTVAAALRGPLLLGAGLLLVRALFILMVFYLKAQGKLWMTGLAVVGLLLPAVLFQLPLRLIDGPSPSWVTTSVWALLGVVSAVALTASLFAKSQPSSPRLGALARWAALLLVVLIWAAVIVILPNRSDYLNGTLSNWWWAVIVGPLSLTFLATIMRRPRLLLLNLVMALAGLWLFLFIHQSPYLLYPTILLSDAINTTQTVVVALASTGFFTLVLLPFGIWLYYSALRESN